MINNFRKVVQIIFLLEIFTSNIVGQTLKMKFSKSRLFLNTEYSPKNYILIMTHCNREDYLAGQKFMLYICQLDFIFCNALK